MRTSVPSANAMLSGLSIAVVLLLASRASHAEIAGPVCHAQLVEVFPGTEDDPTAAYVLIDTGYSMANGCLEAKILTTGPDMTNQVFGAIMSPEYGSDERVLVATQAASTLFGIAADEGSTGTIPVPDGNVRVQPGAPTTPSTVNYGCMSGGVIPPLRWGCALRRDPVKDWVLDNPRPVNNAGQVGAVLALCDLDAGIPPQDCGSGGTGGSAATGGAGGAGGTLASGGTGGETLDASSASEGAQDAPSPLRDAEDPQSARPPTQAEGGCSTNAPVRSPQQGLAIALVLGVLKRRRLRSAPNKDRGASPHRGRDSRNECSAGRSP